MDHVGVVNACVWIYNSLDILHSDFILFLLAISIDEIDSVI